MKTKNKKGSLPMLGELKWADGTHEESSFSKMFSTPAPVLTQSQIDARKRLIDIINKAKALPPETSRRVMDGINELMNYAGWTDEELAARAEDVYDAK